jgi:hypothetical protein
MEWVQATTTAPRVGMVYGIRGWTGVFSKGIDDMCQALNRNGVTARVFMSEQYPEMSAEIIKKCKASPQHEPICFIGHSRGVDASIMISRELEKAGIAVDYIASLDSVDQDTVSANVRLCENFWMPGIIGNTNLLRGIPLKQEPGALGKLVNYNLDTDYRSWRLDSTDHVSLDDDPGIQKRIVDRILEICPERSKWTPAGPIGQWK